LSTTDDFINEHSVLVCLGAGGVGKTTTAAALAIRAARLGRRVVVLTIDPARRLADAMGLSGQLGNEPALVAGPWDGRLWAAMLDPTETLNDIVADSAANAKQADRILANKLYINISTSLGGTQEYMASERLLQLHKDERFDLVVLDTPPSKHAFDFLDSPGRLNRFFEHPLYKNVLMPRKGIRRAVNVATQTGLKAISQVVGASIVTDAVEFFSAFDGMTDGFSERAGETAELLVDIETGYAVVTSPRQESLKEADWIIERLAHRDIEPDVILVNRRHHFEADPSIDPKSSEGKNLADLVRLSESEATALTEVNAKWQAPMVEIPEQAVPVADLAGLNLFDGVV
jgi:anion-transporting  ArsA/GET3 family ATPase